jgi:outer membrane protein assembly factor BamB
VFAYRASDGRKVWTYRAGGAVKGGLTAYKNMLIFGDYSGSMTALRARDGSKVWDTGTSGRLLGKSGQFYATPAVAFGRVYAGNTDGFVYSFGASSGKLAWRHRLGGYVYAAPAVTDVPGMRPAVLTGSYSGKFVALDARSGDVLWTYKLKGKISGAPSVIGRIVYFSNLARRSTVGLDVRNGHVVFHFGRGAFNPAISDGRRLFLTGYSSLYGFLPKDAKPASRAHRARHKKSSRSTRAKRRDKTR